MLPDDSEATTKGKVKNEEISQFYLCLLWTMWLINMLRVSPMVEVYYKRSKFIYKFPVPSLTKDSWKWLCK